MNDLFGLSMTYIMVALLILLGIAIGSVLWVLLRNRVMFMIGVRNIPRRRAQTVLIIIGLMLSTLIISAAFGIGDTSSYSITKQAYDTMWSVDQIVQVRAGDEDDEGDPFALTSLVSPRPIPNEDADRFVEEFLQVEGVDGAVSVLRAPVAVSNPGAGQEEPFVLLVGIDGTSMAGFEDDISSTSGEQVSVTDLGRQEIFVNETGADDLDIQVGDVITVYALNVGQEFTVKEIVEDRILTGGLGGVTAGMVVDMPRARELLFRPGDVDMIAVSNDGGVRNDLERSEEIKDELNLILEDTPWSASAVKKVSVDAASEISSFITTFFVLLGLFAISAGMLLIFLIFVMLAAERRVEMGMARAVGTKRADLVQMFLSEGMTYNLVAAAVGCGLGVLVSIAMVRVMAALFAGFGLQIEFHITARSLIVAYSLGVVLTFLTVTFSSWRTATLNIVSAIRDQADPIVVIERPRGRGILSNIRWLLFKPTSLRQWLLGLAFLGAAALVAGLATALFILGVEVGDNGTAGGIAGVLLVVFAIALYVVAAVVLIAGLNAIFQWGPVAIVAGLLLMLYGWNTTLAFPFGAGWTMVCIGAALLLQFVGVHARTVWTTMSAVLLFFWLLFAGNNVPGVKELDGDIEMFFLSGVTMVLAATFLLVYNSDLILGLLTRVTAGFSRIVPSVRTAVAYPMANKFRTGMTIAMISLVMFALVVMSTINENFDRIFLGEDAGGGYNVVVTENPTNPIPPPTDSSDDSGLTELLEGEGVDTSSIERVDVVRIANRRIAEVRNKPAPGEESDWVEYGIVGPADGFLANNQVPVDQRAVGFESDEEVWREVATNPRAAVIDAFANGEGGGPGDAGFSVEGIELGETNFESPTVQIHDASAPGRVRDVQIIGIIALSATAIHNGLYVNPTTFDEVFPQPESSVHFVRLVEGTDEDRAAKDIEAALLSRGVQAESIGEIVDEQQASSRGFLYLIQGFMAIGLFVGIAAVGVVAFRTVVERRQQIGMMRAIGYTRGQVGLSFLMESAFVALMGVGSGIVLALLLSWQLMSTDEFVAGGVDNFYIPWLQILVIAGLAFVASLLMTIIPSRQASGIPIAEALRYE